MADLLILLHEKETTAGTTEEWCLSRGVSYHVAYSPDLTSKPFDLDFKGLIACGGDIQTWEEPKYPWLREEKKFLRQAIDLEKKILGLCLGGQLLAEQLGATVNPGPAWEIGWYEIDLTEEKKKFTGFHWHSSTFNLPPDARLIACSMQCLNQGFRFGKNLVGLQFHAEVDDFRVEKALSNYDPDAKGYVQSLEKIRELKAENLPKLKEWYFQFLDEWWRG